MDAVIEVRLLLGAKPRHQLLRLGKFGIAQIAHQPEVGHDGGAEPRSRPGWLNAHHVQLARGQAVGGDPLGEQRLEIVARTDDDGFGMHRATRRLDGGWAYVLDQG